MQHRFVFGPFTLNVPARKLWRETQEIALPSRAFDALAYLIHHRDRPIDKDELIRAVWGGAFVSDDSLVHCVSVVRRALQDDTERPRFVATLPRRGYQFVWPDVEVLSEPHAATTSVEPDAVVPAVMRPRLWPIGLVLAGAAVIVFALAAALWTQPREGRPGRPVLLGQLPPEGTTLSSGGILSPDGRYVAFAARAQDTGVSRLWVRSLDASQPRVIAGTDGATKPFWSPDSQALGYFAGDKLKTVTLVGESARTIAHLSVSAGGGTWSADDVIVFSDSGRGLYAIGSGGGTPAQLTAIDPAQDASHAWPYFLPGQQHLLYTIASWNPDRAGIWVRSLDAAAPARRISATVSPAIYAPEGYLVYVEADTLVAAPFDAATRALAGDPIPLVQNVGAPRLIDGDMFSMSGPLLSFRGGTRAEQLVWFTRTGSRSGRVEGPTVLYNPMISPDGRQLVATGSPTREPGLWLVDLEAHASTRIAAEGIGPLWSPDGRRIAFTARGGLDIVVSSTIGRAHERVLLTDEERKVVHDWSPDGRFIVYSRTNADTNLDLWLLPVDAPGDSVPLLRTAANEKGARISPDGRWIAYTSDESGAAEVYVQEFPGLGSKRALSSGGGAGAFWREDGRELFYLSPDRTLMAVDIAAGDTISIGRPRPLFRAPVAGEVSEARNHYVAVANGERFLVNVIDESVERSVITMLVNWTAQLEAAQANVNGRNRHQLMAAAK
jgi:Tol biopolymer transport system component/DNA-binding winged helix-turn-helix (wHTH) protein